MATLTGWLRALLAPLLALLAPQPTYARPRLSVLVASGLRFSGGDPAADPIYPALPDDISTLSDEQLAEHLASLQSLVQRVADGDEELVGDRDVDVVLEQTEAAVEAIETLRQAQQDRADEAEEVTSRLADLATRARGETTEQDPPADPAPGDDPAPVDDPQAADDPAVVPADDPAADPVAASARRRALRRVPRRAPSADPALRPDPSSGPRVTLTAAADVAGFSAGQQIRSMADLAQAFINRHRSLGRGGDGERVPVATFHTDGFPEDRYLPAGSETVTNRRIQAATARPALLASGGLCAPVQIRYEIDDISEDMIPVIDSLPRFGAERGGIVFRRPATIASIGNAIGVITAADDAGSAADFTKTCQRIVCPATSEVDVSAFFRCLEVGNLPARTDPENLAHWINLQMAAFARLREMAMLDAIKAASTAVTAARVAGANATLLGHIALAAAAYRNRHRMNPEAVLRVLLPDWILDMLQVDELRRSFVDAPTDEAGFITKIRAFGVEPTFYVDGPTSGTGQIFGTQGAGAILAWPGVVQWGLFSEGSFLYLDGGELNLGLVRDSTLNSTNDYQLFGEVFENVAFTGTESIWVTSTVCPNGATGAAETISCPVAA